MDTVEVLVVEDNKIARTELAELLGRHKYKVRKACNAKEALRKVDNPRVGVVLMDINMPGELDGIDAAARISSIYPAKSIVFLTAHGHRDEYRKRARSEHLESVPWVLKPLVDKNRRDLLSIVDREVERAERYRRDHLVGMIRAAETNPLGRLEAAQLVAEIGTLYDVPVLAEISKESMAARYESSVLSDASGDINYRAYQEAQDEILENHAGEYVAFLDGDLVGHSADRQQLVDSVYREFQRSDVFVTLAKSALETVRFNRPLRVRRKVD